MFKQIIYIFLVAILLASCKSTSVVTDSRAAAMSANKVIKKHYANTFNQETIIARMKVKYRGKSNLPGVTASLRIEKDNTIWISLSKLGFPVGKVLITPNKVSYYEKINRTYFEGDFKLLSDWLGTELDFEKVQNLLLGQAILDLKEARYSVDLQENNYQLKPRKPNELFDILFLINASNYKIDKQQVHQTGKDKTLTIDYKKYEKISNESFPKEIRIAALDGKYITTIDVDYRSVEFNKPVSFPFKIPNNYKEIVLK